MVLPASINTVPIHIERLRPADGSPARGRVVLTADYELQAPAENATLSPPRYVATLDAAGEATVNVIPSNDPALSPSGWTYRVEILLDDYQGEPYSIEVPYDTVGTLELSDIAPVVTPDPVTTYALAASLTAEAQARAAADAALTTALAGKAPTVHTHALADVTGLVTALNALTAAMTPGEWQTPTFNSGAGNAAVGNPTVANCQFRLESPVSGVIRFRGSVGITGANPQFAAQAPFMNLPAPYRPAVARTVSIRTRGVTSTHTLLTVAPNGDVACAHTPLAGGADVPLDGVTFLL